MNAVVLSGRLAVDADTKKSASGQQITVLLLAFREAGKTPKIGIARVSFFEPLSEYAAQFKKGTAVEIAGRLSFRTWQKNGLLHEGLEIMGRTISASKNADDLTLDFRQGRAALDANAPIERPNLVRQKTNWR